MSKKINQPPIIPGARLPGERVRDMTFSKRLRQLMAEQELSPSQLAAKIWGRYTNTEGKYVARGRDRISVWASGRNFPDAKNLEKLAKALDVDVSGLAPRSMLKAAHRGAVDWSITRPQGARGMAFVQIAQYVPAGVAHEIHGLLLQAERETGGRGDK